MPKVLIFIILVSAFFACRPEPAPPLPPAPWKLLAADPGIWNVQSVEDKLFVQTSTSLYTLDSSGAHSPCLNFDPVQFRISISKSIVVKPSVDGKYLDFYATKNVCGGTSKRVDLSQLGLPVLETLNPINWSLMLATDAGQFICPFKINSYEYNLALFSVQFTDASKTVIDTVTVQKIDVPDVSQCFEFNEVNGKIFSGYRSVTDEFNTILVNTDGSWQSVFPDLGRQVFSLGNDSYALGTNDVYKSSDAGNSWTHFSDAYNRDGWPDSPKNMRFTTVYGKLIAFSNFAGPHLYVIEETVDPNSEKYWELDHSGIDDVSIYTDILVQSGNWVYLRTDKGVLGRPAATFFTAK